MPTDKLIKRDKFYKGIGIILIVFLQAGCAPKITEEDIKRAEGSDPQFKAALYKKREIDLKISSLENKIALEKADMEAKISVLRTGFQNKKAGIEAEIARVRQELEPERKAIKDKIEKLKQELKPFQTRLAGIESMLKDTQNLIKKSRDTNIALQDKARWDNHIQNLEKEKEGVKKEIDGFKQKIRLYELELQILR